MKLRNTFNDKNDFTGIYRGYVVWNDDPIVQGRIKIFIPGVYDDKYEALPECLPWARPFSPSFGGGSNNPNNEDKHVLNDEVGWCSVPHYGDIKTGSQVFVFFENGDINYPVYFGVAQSGEGWFSEHPNQHCFRSDNIRVRIDENVYDKRSTTKFDSYNTYNSDVAKANLERKCKKENWKFDEVNGNIQQLETRLDIEIEATKINAVNLNIHGNVNMHIDGDWFVEHIGDYYEYRKGDRYIKQDGNTYIEEKGIHRKVLNGPKSLEHNGQYTRNHIGDSLITQHGKYHDQIDNNVTHIYGENLRTKVGKSYYEMVGYDKNVDVANNYNTSIINNCTLNIGGFFDFGVDSYLDFNIKDNISFHSREGNILLQTDGLFDLMEGPVVTCNGFKNLGTRGNIQFISTFGNINMQCIKNDALANFNQKSTIVPWNPSFITKVQKMSGGNFNPVDAMLSGMNLSTDVNNLGDFISLLDELDELKIYDGLPVFIPSKMIIQNPTMSFPNNENDLSWIPIFRNEALDWRDIHDDVMWKLPGRMMGNINIETWSGDINIKTESTIGCAGNINIKASEKGGTLPGYKVGTITFDNYADERIYPDPRDLFLDSNFEAKQLKMNMLFDHGTNFEMKSVLHESTDMIVQGVFGKIFKFSSTNYNKFYEMNGLNVVTFGNPGNATPDDYLAVEQLKEKEAPKLGCTKCITDYLMGIPGIQEIFYINEDVINLVGGKHEYGFQKLNPKDKSNTRGTFNILSNDFNKISIGDGHAIGMGFMDNSFSSNSIGGFIIKNNGDFNCFVGKNSINHINCLRKRGESKNDYKYEEHPADFKSPMCLDLFVEKMGCDYKFIGRGNDYVTPKGSSISLAQKCVGPGTSEDGPGPMPKSFDAKFKSLVVMPKIEWRDNGFLSIHNETFGIKKKRNEKIDTRLAVDYGFNFEKSKKLLKSFNTSELIVNFYEHDIYEDNIDRWIDHQISSGGDSRWFQIQRFDQDEHVEVSANLSAYSYTFVDLSKNHKKHYKYHNDALVWWDNEKFNEDLVKWFPDSDFEVKSEKYEQMWKTGDLDNTSDYREHRGWSKYGNHVVNKKHPDYLRPTDKCAASYKMAEDKEKDPKELLELVDTPCELWKRKKGAGVKDIHNEIRATEPQPNCVELNTCNCGKNQNIEDKYIFNARTDMKVIEIKNAENNNFFDTFYTGDINRRTLTYKAAVNSHIVELNSDHAALIKTDQSKQNSYKDKNYTLEAGNIFRTIMKGNQGYYNYALDPKTQGDYIVKHAKHSNNFEVSQNGFPINKFKILNGTDTRWYQASSGPGGASGGPAGKWPDGKNPEDAKYGDNEFIISNGGNGDEDPPTKGKGVGMYPLVSALNNFKISNGTNFENLAYNNVGIDNGLGVFEGANVTTLNNGNILNKGQNIIRINNEGMQQGDDVVNSITLNNDHQQENLILSDRWKGSSNNGNAISPVISLYSAGAIMNSANKEIISISPKFKIKSIEGDFSIDNFITRSNTISINSSISESISNVYSIKSNGFYATSDAINLTAPIVAIEKLNAVGTLQGHLNGSMNGCAMFNGYQYSIDWPVKGSMPTMTVRHPGKVTLTPTLIHKKVKPEPPVYEQPSINKLNSRTEEAASFNIIKSFKKIFKSFIKMELSLMKSNSTK